MTILSSHQTAAIPASIEMSPSQVFKIEDLGLLFPPLTRVYLTDLGIDPVSDIVAAAKRIRDMGYTPVPHIAARRQADRETLEERIRALAGEADVRDLLVIGGGLDRQAGEFSSTMDVLETGLIDKYGITDLGVAGHPEGSPDFTEEVAVQALRFKSDFQNRSDARLRIVTQFGFNGHAFVRWAEGLAVAGIDLPVHLGVAGPTKVSTLIRYAAMCGVGNSLAILKKRGLSLSALALSHSPEETVAPIEAHWRDSPNPVIDQLHVFPFGGVRKASEWLVNRGSWARPLDQVAGVAEV